MFRKFAAVAVAIAAAFALAPSAQAGTPPRELVVNASPRDTDGDGGTRAYLRGNTVYAAAPSKAYRVFTDAAQDDAAIYLRGEVPKGTYVVSSRPADYRLVLGSTDGGERTMWLDMVVEGDAHYCNSGRSRCLVR